MRTPAAAVGLFDRPLNKPAPGATSPYRTAGNQSGTRQYMSSPKSKRVCLVSEPGLIQQATRAMLGSIPDVVVVATASGALSATAMISQLQPDLLLVDANLPDDEVEALLYWSRENYPWLQSIVMTRTSRQRSQVLAWGAHAAIPRASLSDELRVVLDQSTYSNKPEKP